MAYDVEATERYIREAARRRGIDPDIAVRVAKSEGLARNTWQSNLTKGGRREPSYGPFQLLVGGEGTGYPGGMGNDFKRATGLDPADPANVNATIDYAMDRAAKDGWGAWYGAAKVGVGKRTGIGGSAKPALGGDEPVRMADSGATMSDATSFVPNERIPSSSGPVAASPTTQAAGPVVQIGAEKSNKLHEAMVANAMRQGSNARNGWDAVGALAQVWAGSDQIKKNDAANESSLSQAVAGAGLDPAYQMAAQLGGDRDSLAGAIMAQQENRTAAAQRAEEQAWRQDERSYQRGQDAAANERADRQFALQSDLATRKAEGFRTLTPEEVQQRGLPPGSYQVGPDGRLDEVGKNTAPTVNVSTSQDEGEFSKKAAARMVDRFGTLADGGAAAANVKQTVPVMRELLAAAPTGPLAGRLAEAYPGFSTAGDAFRATVNQIAPTLRIPGSGAQSDRDMDLLLGSFPRLSNDPAANGIIMDVFERKADLNLQRSQIASAALRNEIDPSEADRQLAALDQTPLFDDAMRQRLGLGGGAPSATAPSDQNANAAAPVRRARNPQTGETLELRNGQWVPVR